MIVWSAPVGSGGAQAIDSGGEQQPLPAAYRQMS
jgi:hypothetical protein